MHDMAEHVEDGLVEGIVTAYLLLLHQVTLSKRKAKRRLNESL